VLGAQLLIHGGKRHRNAAPDGPLLTRPRDGHGRRVAGLHPEVEFFPHGSGESTGQAGRADPTRPAGAALEPDRQPLQDVQVLLYGGPDPGALDLHRHLGVHTAVVAQPCLVDLGDRRGRGRFLLQLRENLPRRPERLGYHLLHLLPRRRLGPVLLREQITASGQQLAQLGRGNPALFQGTPQRQRERCRPAGGVLPAPSPAQVRAQPMPRRDTADLPVAPEARHRAPCAADNLQRPWPRPARHQHLRRHDDDHRHDQRDAQHHGEERDRMPRLGRLQ
jgi:hypothetical protein